MDFTLYSFAYLMSLTGLVLWFFYQHKPKLATSLSALFLGSFVLYAFSLAFSPGDFSNKLWVLFRDMTVLGIASQVFMWVRRSQWGFFALLILVYGFYFAFYQNYLNKSFNVQNIELAENAELLIGLKSSSDIGSFESWMTENLSEDFEYAQAFDIGKNPNTYLDEYITLDIPEAMISEIEKISQKLRKLEYISNVEPNEKIFVEPVEDKISPMDNLNFSNDPELKNQWSYDPLDIKSVHQVLKGIKPPKGPAKIAILDTGVDANHEDLKEVYFSIDKSSDSDAMGHGTHCAGIAAAVSNNGLGISSMDPSSDFVRVTSVKVLNFFGGGTQQSIIQGMIKAADKGADVISLSLGGLSNQARELAYTEAVKYCNDKGAIVIVAAGNSNADARKYAPANVPGVIAVGAVDQDLKKAAFSNTVDQLEMGISAPGFQIFSTYPKNQYKSFSGTSMACPQVSGLVGIMKAINPALNTKEVYDILKEHAESGPSFDKVGALIQPLPSLNSIID